MTSPTPYYQYDLDLLRHTLAEAKSQSNKFGYHVHYALKANSNARILEIIKDHGFGADCVSGNEVDRAIEIGFDPQHIVFAGVGKSDAEINIGLTNDIFCFNCESIQEIEIINELAFQQGKVAQIALRINPNVDAKTHEYITTGLEENKFGISSWEFEKVLETLSNCSYISCIGLHFHIGSQITDLEVFAQLAQSVNVINRWFADHGLQVQMINLGGGLGIDYQNPNENLVPDFKSYFETFDNHLELLVEQEVHFELGRSLVGQCGALITRVLFIKHGLHKKFMILDGGMTELLRPALYQSQHFIENISRAETDDMTFYDVVGPVCESSDCFGKGVNLPTSQRGDIIAIKSAGAYSEVMASNYNLRKLNPAEYQSIKKQLT